MPQIGIGNPTEKLDATVRAPFQPLAIRPGAHDLERHAGAPAGVDGHFEPFVRHQGRHDEGESLGNGGVGVEKLGIDRRIDHKCLAIIVSAHPAGNML